MGAGPADGRFILGSCRGLVFSHPEEVEGTAGTVLIQRNGWQGEGTKRAENLCNQRKCLRDLLL